jgi:sugar phosphate permease
MKKFSGLDPKSERKYALHQWLNVVAFGLLYLSIYIGRYMFNNALPQIAEEADFSGSVQSALQSSVFFGYAAGCLFNGILVDKHKGKRLIAIGGVGSVMLNILLLTVRQWPLMWVLSFLNGYIQSFVWIGGISLMVHWFPRKSRGLPIGIINMCSAFAYLIVLYLPDVLSISEDWGFDLSYPLFVICYVTVVFTALCQNDPPSVDLLDYRETDPEAAVIEATQYKIPFRFATVLKFFLRDRKVLCWMMIAMLSGFCRYAMLSWIPAYFSVEGAGPFLNARITNITLSVGMAVGTLVVCKIATQYFYRNIGVVVTAASGLCAALVVLFPYLYSSNMVLIGIFLEGFFLFGINGILWLYAMDRGGRRFSGTLTGLLNAPAYLSASQESNIVSAILSAGDDGMLVFLTIEIVCMVMIVFGLLVCKRDTNIEKIDL